MTRDLRHAIRLLLRSKGWTLVVVVTLALGIGANTAIFTAINSLTLRTLPVPHPDTLVRFRNIGENQMGNNFSSYGYTTPIEGYERDTNETFPYAIYQRFREANTTMVDLFACAPQGQMNVIYNGQAELASAFLASGSYFDVLGVRARIGRTFTPEDDKPGAPPVVVLSDGYWKRRFGGDPNVIGKVLTIAPTQVTVIGVTAPEFTGVQQVLTDARDLTFPLVMDRQYTGGPTPNGPSNAALARLDQTATWWLQVMGRVKPGVTPEQVQANLDGTFQAAARDGWAEYFGSLKPEERTSQRNANRTKVPQLRVQNGSRGIYDVSADTYRSMTLLGVVVGLVLLIVCANVANLLLSRATARQREISVRLSLGATRARLIRQLLTESLLLAAIGAAFGGLVAYWGRQLLPGNLATAAPIDWRILGFVLALTIATGILFGLAPALRASLTTSGYGLGAMLKDGGRGVSGGRSRLGKSLVVAQVAISLVLLVGAGLFLRTVRNLRHVDVGFETENLLLIPVNPSLNRYEQPRIVNLYAQLFDQLPQVPAVRAVTASNPALLSGSINRTQIWIQGKAKPNDKNSTNRLVVVPNFFETLGIKVKAGRAFTERDTQTSPKVVIVNEAAARKYFAGENPVGQHFGQSYETTGDMEVVAVVSDAKYSSLRDEAPPTMYVPFLQQRPGFMTLQLRTAGDATKTVTAVREAIRRVDPNLPILSVTTQSEQIERRFAQEKVFAQAYALFGSLAVLIAAVGLFGLMSYSVARRTNEIGIRMALGAKREDVVSMILRESMILVLLGVVIGTAAALGVGRFVASLLFNLAPTDPMTIAISAALMIGVSALAGYLPARAASRVDPMVALRDE
jgi:predicted permease